MATEFTIEKLMNEIVQNPQSITGLGDGTNWPATANRDIPGILCNTAVYSAQIDRRWVNAQQLHNCVRASEWSALSADMKQAWNELLMVAALNPVRVDADGAPAGNAGTRNAIQTIWGAGTDTRGYLNALQTKTGTRAEELWGDGKVVSLEEVRQAHSMFEES